MDLLQLRTFIAVVDTGSFTSAANHLNCVQTNITSRIKKLENHLGGKVFERGRGGASLTPFGEKLYHLATDLLQRFEDMEQELKDVVSSSAPLRLGSMETTAAVRLPVLLRELRKEYPSAPISLYTAATGDLLPMLWGRKLDAAFVSGPVDHKRFKSVLAFNEKLVLVKTQSTEVQNTLLASRKSCSYRRVGEAWLQSQGKIDYETLEMGSLDAIMGCVEIGMGFAILPLASVEKYHGYHELEIQELPCKYGYAKTYLIWRYDARTSHALKGLIDMIATK